MCPGQLWTNDVAEALQTGLDFEAMKHYQTEIDDLMIKGSELLATLDEVITQKRTERDEKKTPWQLDRDTATTLDEQRPSLDVAIAANKSSIAKLGNIKSSDMQS